MRTNEIQTARCAIQSEPCAYCNGDVEWYMDAAADGKIVCEDCSLEQEELAVERAKIERWAEEDQHEYKRHRDWWMVMTAGQAGRGL